jgi:hypothetical protein
VWRGYRVCEVCGGSVKCRAFVPREGDIVANAGQKRVTEGNGRTDYLFPCPGAARESCGLPNRGYTVLVWGTDASTPKPTCTTVHQSKSREIVALRYTSCPVQNIGHFSHGTSLALPSQVLKYGLRTMSGNTGGVRVEAWPTAVASADATVNKEEDARILDGRSNSQARRMEEAKQSGQKRKGRTEIREQAVFFLCLCQLRKF